MKIRKGFVTNSSSSSFILHFVRDEYETVEEAVRESLDWDMGVYKEWIYEHILNDIMKNILTRQEVVDYIKDEVFWDVVYEIQDEFDIKLGWEPNSDEYIWTDKSGNNVTEKYNDLLTERAAKKAEEYILWKDTNRHIYAKVEYGSDFDAKTSEFESHVMPNLSCVVHKFSHH